MGEIDMDGPRDEEGRILDPEFYPVIIVYFLHLYYVVSIIVVILHSAIILFYFYLFFTILLDILLHFTKFTHPYFY
jgi:hypothetical protein